MELRHLRYFIAAAEEEHFGRASERLHITRPAVSQIISDLEGELRTPLFERLAHRVRLTAAGQVLLPRLQAIMSDIDEALVVTKRVGDGKSGVLSIGYGSLTLLHSHFRAAIKLFCETYPDVSLSLMEMPTFEQPNALATGIIHAGFMHFGPSSEFFWNHRTGSVLEQEATTLDWLPIQNGGLGVVLHVDHPLAARTSLSLSELGDERFVIVPRSSSSPGYGPLYTLCQEAGFEPRIVQEVRSITSQLNLISVGMGIGLAVIGKNFAYPPGLVVIPLDKIDYVTRFVFGWIKGQRGAVLDRMIVILRELSELRELP